MDGTFYDGHDELYQHAKFGEDRTTRAAGCRCKNVVFVFMWPSSLGGGRILRRTLSVRLSVCPSVPLSLPSVTSFRQPLA